MTQVDSQKNAGRRVSSDDDDDHDDDDNDDDGDDDDDDHDDDDDDDDDDEATITITTSSSMNSYRENISFYIQSTPALRTPCYYRHPVITDRG